MWRGTKLRLWILFWHAPSNLKYAIYLIAPMSVLPLLQGRTARCTAAAGGCYWQLHHSSPEHCCCCRCILSTSSLSLQGQERAARLQLKAATGSCNIHRLNTAAAIRLRRHFLCRVRLRAARLQLNAATSSCTVHRLSTAAAATCFIYLTFYLQGRAVRCTAAA
jgi:hypothetical protein